MLSEIGMAKRCQIKIYFNDPRHDILQLYIILLILIEQKINHES